MDSCNPAFMQLSKRIGAKTLYKYYDAFGLFDKTGVGLSEESSGIFHDLDKVGPVELATMSFGQRFKITPLQMCTGQQYSLCEVLIQVCSPFLIVFSGIFFYVMLCVITSACFKKCKFQNKCMEGFLYVQKTW